MHKPFLAVAALALSATPLLAAQDAPPPPEAQTTPAVPNVAPPAPPAPPVIETQANPVGSTLPPSAVPPDPASAEDAVPPAMPADPNYKGKPYAGALTPPPAEALNKSYPVCSAAVQDSCVNRSEAPRHAARRPHHRHPG